MRGPELEFNVELEKPGEACGLFGVYAPGEDIVQYTYLGMQALQHRGQTGAGMAVFDGTGGLHIEKDNGIVTEALPEKSLITLEYQAAGPVAIGHDRYSTSGKTSDDENARLAQPFGNTRDSFALGHNGHIENISKYASRLGVDISGTESDSESLVVILDALEQQRGDLVDALQLALPKIEGAYSLVIGEHDRLIGVRDRRGFRPLSIGRLPSGNYVLASETTAFDMIDAEFVRDVEPAEIVIIDKDGLHSEKFDAPVDERFCMFEYVYFAHPNSLLRGKNVYEVRETLGRSLGVDFPIDVDMVIGVQNSGAPYARGYAHQTQIPEELAITKNGYINRTFIQDRQLTREQSVRLKHQPNKFMIEGKRVVLVDDSIVRGTTMRELVKMTRRAGAAEVHVRIPSPPYANPCFFGMDTRKTSDLAAYRKSVEEVREEIGADSLEFLSLGRVLEVIDDDFRKRDKIAGSIGPFCTACVSGNYPEEVSIDLMPSRSRLAAVSGA